MKRTALARKTPLERTGRLKQRRHGPPRRTRHPIRLPASPAPEDDYEGDPVAFGLQSEICKATQCCVCWAFSMRGILPMVERGGVWVVDWTQLPEAPYGSSHPHHEPRRGLGCDSDDDDTLPLCAWHHVEGYGAARHHEVRQGWALVEISANAYFGHFGIDWTAVIREMRRRTEARRA